MGKASRKRREQRERCEAALANDSRYGRRRDVREYTLGQFFDVWGVRLTKKCLGGYCAAGARRLRAFADGRPLSSPRCSKLLDGEQIVLAYGTPAQIARATS